MDTERDGRAQRGAEVLGVQALPDAVKTLVCQKAEGNPFYLEEVTRAFVETGILARAGEGYALARPVTPQDVPDTVQGVIMARIDRLDEARKRKLAAAVKRQHKRLRSQLLPPKLY